MLRHVRDALRLARDAVRRAPAVARLVAVAALLLVAASAHLLVGAGPASRPGVTWLVLLVVGVVLALLTGTPRHRWPLPAIWLVACSLAASEGTGSPATVPALVGGGVAFTLAVVTDVVTARRARPRSRT